MDGVSIMSNTNHPLSALSARYLTGLRAVTAPKAGVEGQAVAWEVGSEAAAMGLGTLDLARMHQAALAELTAGGAPGDPERLIGRAEVFFNAALVPIEGQTPAAKQAGNGLQQVKLKLKKRTLELADAGRELKAGIAKRKRADTALKASEEKSARVLEESRILEEKLKAITHKLFKVHEAERATMSAQLHEEIAMTLLGIHVRLLALKKEASVSRDRLAQEITVTRRLVEQAVDTIKRFNQEFGIRHEA